MPKNYWTVIGHNETFNLRQDAPVSSWLSETDYWIEQLKYDAANDAVYAVGTQNLHNNNTCNVYVTRMSLVQPYTQWPGIAANPTPIVLYNTGYIPGMRDPQLHPSLGVYNGVIYAGWYESNTPSQPGFPTNLRLRQILDAGDHFSLYNQWTFNGGYPGNPNDQLWNCPYRIDVEIGNQVRNTISISFMGGYVYNGNQIYVARRIITTTDNFETAPYDTRLSTSHPYWVWNSIGGHLEWYRSCLDYATNNIWATWVEDGLQDGGTQYNSTPFVNRISP